MRSKTTLYLPEDLRRELKALAGRRGETLSGLLAEGARLVLERYGRETDREELLRRSREAEEALRRGLYRGSPAAGSADDLAYGFPKVAEGRGPKR